MFEVEQDGFLISTCKNKLNLDVIFGFVARAYWSLDRTREAVLKSLENSIVYGVYQGSAQVGWARIVTDYATFSWLCDVFIDESMRGRGLGKFLISSILQDLEQYNLRMTLLGTRDAHGLYEQFGWTPLEDPARFMVRRKKING